MQTTTLVQDIAGLMLSYKHRMREELPKIYSQDLINNLFRHPYTKIRFLQDELNVSRITATKRRPRRHRLVVQNLIRGTSFYFNDALFDLLWNVGGRAETRKTMYKICRFLDIPNGTSIEKRHFLYTSRLLRVELLAPTVSRWFSTCVVWKLS